MCPRVVRRHQHHAAGQHVLCNAVWTQWLNTTHWKVLHVPSIDVEQPLNTVTVVHQTAVLHVKVSCYSPSIWVV